ncbi:hypothetical protein Q5H93_05075 [Hymenobacter sp. ASUV-10]|uniref:Lipoprotein n=1 Tax=Hymenobacter aranciens TaxID=3063996 RepID=A0ABT9B746_9BACT|nr:hypothetical protein [Hymenobacter sp. ASUV-10]MDO7874096.1 hypothetical protein [Hymenobacter sp. ASUV-10]
MAFRLQYVLVAGFALAASGCSSSNDPKPVAAATTLQGRWTNEGSEERYYSRDYVYIDRTTFASRPGAATVIADSTMSYTDTAGNVNSITPLSPAR